MAVICVIVCMCACDCACVCVWLCDCVCDCVCVCVCDCVCDCVCLSASCLSVVGGAYLGLMGKGWEQYVSRHLSLHI